MLVGLVTSFTLSSTHAFANTDEMFVEQPSPGAGYILTRAIPGGETNGWSSHLIAEQVDQNGKVTSVATCNSILDSACKSANLLRARAVLPFCKAEADNNCIESISAQDPSGKDLQVSSPIDFMGKREQDFVADPATGLANGSFTSAVNIPDAPHKSGSYYIPVVTTFFQLDRRNNGVERFSTGGIQAGLYAVNITKGSFEVPHIFTDLGNWDNPFREPIHINNGVCVQNDATNCASAEPLPLNYKFGMKLRFAHQLSGWYSGRLADPSFSISSDARGNELIEIFAKPVQVPLISHYSQLATLPAEITSYLSSPSFRSSGGVGFLADDYHGGGSSQDMDHF